MLYLQRCFRGNARHIDKNEVYLCVAPKKRLNMKKSFLIHFTVPLFHTLLLLSGVFLVLTFMPSCKRDLYALSEEDQERLSKGDPEYDTERQVIYDTKQIDYDVKAIAYPFWNKKKDFDYSLGIRLHFFNYGDDIRLFNGLTDDCFCENSTINDAVNIDNNMKIIIEKEVYNKKYGNWALVRINAGDVCGHNIFMTPLALKDFKNNKTSSLIFVQFVTLTHFMNAIFKGGPDEVIIINNLKKFIIPESEICSYGNNYPGRFWHKINN